MSIFVFGINWLKMKLKIKNAMPKLALNPPIILILRNCYAYGEYGGIFWDISFVYIF